MDKRTDIVCALSRGRIILCILLLMMSGCESDNFDSVMENESNVTDSSSNGDAPLAGNGGLIASSDISTSSTRLLWARASDNITAQSDLRYRVYRSNTNNINTVVDAETNGILVADWTADLTSVTVVSLLPRRTYYFNVIVMDEDGYRSAYNTVSAMTDGVLYLFSAGTYQGNLSTMYTSSIRADLDSYCSSSPTFVALSCSSVRALISATAIDSIKNMPSRYGIPTDWEVWGPDGDKIADSWDDLFDHLVDPLYCNLQSVNVADSFWWSGSDAVGNFDAVNNCNGWTNGTNAYQGRSGAHNRTDESWISEAIPGPRNCDNTLHLLCVGWQD
jgi:hypothetical protein